MKIFAIDRINPGVNMEQIVPHLKDEAKAAWKLYSSGVFRELYFKTNGPGVVIVLECESVEEAKKIMETVPLVKNGLISFDYIPVGHFTPFEILFEK